MALVWVCSRGDLEDGEIFKAEVDGVGAVAIYCIGDDVFATSDVCTHGEASLSEDGFIDGFRVVCSWHDGQFDLRTGEPMALPCFEPLKTYAVMRDGDAVYIETNRCSGTARAGG
jgi:nitrite reductase/ring-hydroxylating ferredoxin subunit